MENVSKKAKKIKGEKLGAFVVTEPSSGSDLGNQQTSAVDMGDYRLLNGSKIFIRYVCTWVS